MFDELDNKNAQNTIPQTPFIKGGATAKTEDIFFEVDKIVKPEMLRPRDNNSLPVSGTIIPAETGWLKNKMMIFGLILGGLIVVIGGGYLGLRLMVKSAAPINTEVKKEEVNNNPSAPEVTAPAAEKVNNVVEQPIQPTVAQPADSDQDGLPDEEEIKLGINPNNSDTDQDGLTDREEVKVYGTNPLKADTDGDGFKDGDEVKNNYNPNGPGKLYEINR